MKQNEALLAELKMEAANTRKLLALVPADKKSWKPHEKSMSLESLAKHLPDLITWVGITLDQDELDFAKPYPKTPPFTDTATLLGTFDKNLGHAIAVLEKVKEEEFERNWTMRQGEKIFFTMPKGVVLRSMVFNHMVHHRAQLGVYLRLLDIPIPGIYGPSADDKQM
jgi:uncharacterized damage-inducible protein DinB